MPMGSISQRNIHSNFKFCGNNISILFDKCIKNLCTCHDSIAVGTCAKFCDDDFEKYMDENESWMKIFLVKFAPMAIHIWLYWHVDQQTGCHLRIIEPDNNLLPGTQYDDYITWQHFLHYWPFVRGIHWSTVDSSHKRPVMHSCITGWH